MARHLTPVPGNDHEGALPTPSAVEVLTPAINALAQLREAWDELAAGAPAVAAELVRIATSSKSDFVRVQAAAAVLDRVGLGRIDGHVVRVDAAGVGDPDTRAAATSAAVDAVRDRLAMLAGRAPAAYRVIDHGPPPAPPTIPATVEEMIPPPVPEEIDIRERFGPDVIEVPEDFFEPDEDDDDIRW